MAAVRAGELELAGGYMLPFSECTQGGPQLWLRSMVRLVLDGAGFFTMDLTLASTNDPAVFATGGHPQ